MRTSLDKCSLELIKPGYPWQEVCGDHITWLILRKKIKAPGLRVIGLDQVFLEDFQWKAQAVNNEAHYFSGRVALKVQFETGSLECAGMEFPEETETEEMCREVFLEPQKYLAQLKDRPAERETEMCTIHTSFPSILLDVLPRAESISAEPKPGKSYLREEFAWRARAFGWGKPLEPQIKKVHLAKVGISTMLLEVLLKLEIDAKALESGPRRQVYRSGSLGEKMLLVKDEAIQEVIGLTQESGFYSAVADAEERRLLLKNYSRISLVYISSLTGGERILAACSLEEEDNILSNMAGLELAPQGYFKTKQNFKMQQVDMNRVICRYEQIWGIYLEEPAVPLPAASAPELRETRAPAALAPVIRKKPGEKWLKKQEGPKKKNSEAKLVITVRK